MEMTLVVMAAGVGSRYGGLKQLEAVGPHGETILEYSIFDALRAGFDRIVLVIRPETEADFQRDLGPRLGKQAELTYAHQMLEDLPSGWALPDGRTKPWGTGHAVLVAQSAVRGPFAVINADDFYGSSSFAAVAEFFRSGSSDRIPSFALAGYQVGPTLSESGPVSRALCCADGDGWLERIVEVVKLWKHGDGGRFLDDHGQEQLVGDDDLVSMNMWGFTPALFPELESRFRRFLAEQPENDQEYLLPRAVQSMIDDGSARVRVLRHSGLWCGITFPEDRQRVQDFIASLVSRGHYPPRLWP